VWKAGKELPVRDSGGFAVVLFGGFAVVLFGDSGGAVGRDNGQDRVLSLPYRIFSEGRNGASDIGQQKGLSAAVGAVLGRRG